MRPWPICALHGPLVWIPSKPSQVPLACQLKHIFFEADLSWTWFWKQLTLKSLKFSDSEIETKICQNWKTRWTCCWYRCFWQAGRPSPALAVGQAGRPQQWCSARVCWVHHCYFQHHDTGCVELAQAPILVAASNNYGPHLWKELYCNCGDGKSSRWHEGFNYCEVASLFSHFCLLFELPQSTM